MAEEEFEEYEEEVEEVEDSNSGADPNVSKGGDPQNNNTNKIEQPKAEDKKSINSKKSGASKVSKSKNSANKKIVSNPNNPNNNEKKKTIKSNKTKNTNEKKEENTYKMPTPEQLTSTRAYLEQTVTSVIEEALLELARKRPDNPLEFVGNYILDKAKNKK